MCAIQGLWWVATLEDVKTCVLSYDYDGKPCPTSSDCVSCWREMMECHAQFFKTVCVVQGRWLHAMPDIVNSCVQSKGDYDIQHPRSSDCVSSWREMMECHTQIFKTVCVFQARWLHAMPDIVNSCVQSKGDDDIQHPTSSDCVSYQRAIIECDAQFYPIVCVVQGRWWHATPEIDPSCTLYKGDDHI